MSVYQGLSRKYRPQTFSAIIGQDPVVATLRNAIRQKKTAQAYLFCGTRGTGKTTLARILAKALNCPSASPLSEPCNECPSCQEITEGKNLNVLEIDGASNRGIEDIRRLNESVSYAPTDFGCKIFIIDEAHMLTKEAFNALLKTLEEPPPNVKFFLATTEVHKIPLTIVSRCQKFDLQRIGSVRIAKKLEEILQDLEVPYEEEAIRTVAAFADGSMRVAESVLDQILCFCEKKITEKEVSDCLGTVPSEPFFAFDSAFEKGDLAYAFEWAYEIFLSGKDPSHFFSSLLDHYKNLFTVKMGIPSRDLSPSASNRYAASSTHYTEEQLLYIIDYLLDRQEKAQKSPLKQVTTEMVLLHILRSKHRVSAADLVFRLERLQEQNSNRPPRISEETKERTQNVELPPFPAPPIEIAPEQPTEKNALPEVGKTAAVVSEPIPVVSKKTATRYDTVTRFAAIELEGTLETE